MHLFELDNNYNLKISPEAYTLKPFGVLWNRDKSKDKASAFADLAFVYHMGDFKSDFADIIDEEERESEVILAMQKPKGWKPDVKVREALEFFKTRRNTVSSVLLEDARTAVYKMSKFLRDVDLAAMNVDKFGNEKPIYNVKQIADTVKIIPDLVKALQEAENIVKKEMQATSGQVGSKTKGIFEDIQ